MQIQKQAKAPEVKASDNVVGQAVARPEAQGTLDL